MGHNQVEYEGGDEYCFIVKKLYMLNFNFRTMKKYALQGVLMSVKESTKGMDSTFSQKL